MKRPVRPMAPPPPPLAHTCRRSSAPPHTHLPAPPFSFPTSLLHPVAHPPFRGTPPAFLTRVRAVRLCVRVCGGAAQTQLWCRAARLTARRGGGAAGAGGARRDGGVGAEPRHAGAARTRPGRDSDATRTRLGRDSDTTRTGDAALSAMRTRPGRAARPLARRGRCSDAPSPEGG